MIQITPIYAFADKTYSHLNSNPSNLQAGITNLDTTYSKIDNNAVSLNPGTATYEADDRYNNLCTLTIGNGKQCQKDGDAVAQDDQYCHAVAGGQADTHEDDEYSHLQHSDTQQNIRHCQLMEADGKAVNDGYEQAVVGRTHLYFDLHPEDQTVSSADMHYLGLDKGDDRISGEVHIQDRNEHDYFVLEKTGI